MPAKLHRSLKARCRKLGLKGERCDAYVYGTMNKIEKQRKKKRRK